MQPVARNPIDAVWTDRPAPPLAPAMPHPLEHAGAQRRRKSASRSPRCCARRSRTPRCISDPASIAWLLNIRGGDVPFTPFALGFALVHADGGTELFMDPAKLPEATRAWLGNTVSVAGREALAPALAPAGRQAGAGGSRPARRSGSRRRCATPGRPWWPGPDPCLLPKACKNAVEQQGARNAHARDAVAVCRFLHFLAETGPRGSETEMSAAAKLLALREQVEGFRGESFPAISGAGEHGAIIHYRVTEESNRPIRPNEVYLIDSGAQYPGRHHRHHPHRLDRARRAAGRAARAGDAGAEGPYRHRHAGVPAGRRRRASGRVRPPRAVAGRAGLRPRHRPRRRQLSVGARGAGEPVAPRPAGADRRRA